MNKSILRQSLIEVVKLQKWIIPLNLSLYVIVFHRQLIHLFTHDECKDNPCLGVSHGSILALTLGHLFGTMLTIGMEYSYQSKIHKVVRRLNDEQAK